MRLLLAISVLACWSIVGTDDETVKHAPPDIPKDTLPGTLKFETQPGGFAKLPRFPEDNPYSEEKVALGRKLFFDPILSKDNSIACASCHRPEQGLADSNRISIGIGGKAGTRNVPTIFNRGFGKSFFWDGRATSLEEQALSPMTNPTELGNESVEDVISELKQQQHYVTEFHAIFGDASTESPQDSITAKNLAKAIAAFERVLIYGDTKVDRFRSAEYTALSREARQGMWIFESRGGCWKCHGGENFTDDQFHNTGVGFGEQNRDVGRFKETNNDQDRFKFKTPTLRGIEFTAPYFHDGSRATLKDVVEFYNLGGAKDDPLLDDDMKPLNLNDEEVGFLVEFLKALSQ